MEAFKTNLSENKGDPYHNFKEEPGIGQGSLPGGSTQYHPL